MSTGWVPRDNAFTSLQSGLILAQQIQVNRLRALEISPPPSLPNPSPPETIILTPDPVGIVWNESQVALDLATVLPNTTFVQNSTTQSVVCLITSADIASPLHFYIQTNQYGIFILNNETSSILYQGSLYLPPNKTITLGLTVVGSRRQRILTSSEASAFETNVVLAWIDTFARSSTVPPPLLARNMASFSLAVYQSVVLNNTLFDQAVANEAARAAFSLYLPLVNTDALYDSFPKLDDPAPIQSYVQTLITTSLTYPAVAINPVYQGPPPSTPALNLWTGVNPVLPNWSNVPYLANTFVTMPPTMVPTMSGDATQLQTITESLTEAQKQIAYYFAAQRPPYELCSSLCNLLGGINLSVLDMSQLMALVTMAMSDAGVYAWTVKFLYWGARPFQYISGYSPLIPTPNFPGYISGHSTFSAAWSHMIRLVVPQLGPIVNYIADLSGMSRLYGGIHFSDDNTVGLSAGHSISQSIFDALWPQIRTKQVFI
jgi:membrane-associated phospholipid phosphatase